MYIPRGDKCAYNPLKILVCYSASSAAVEVRTKTRQPHPTDADNPNYLSSQCELD